MSRTGDGEAPELFRIWTDHRNWTNHYAIVTNVSNISQTGDAKMPKNWAWILYTKHESNISRNWTDHWTYHRDWTNFALLWLTIQELNRSLCTTTETLRNPRITIWSHRLCRRRRQTWYVSQKNLLISIVRNYNDSNVQHILPYRSSPTTETHPKLCRNSTLMNKTKLPLLEGATPSLLYLKAQHPRSHNVPTTKRSFNQIHYL